MNTLIAPPSTESWSWADQISTYRFWGLLAFYTMSGGVAGSLFQLGIAWAAFDASGSPFTLGLVSAVSSFASIFGVLLAWVWVLADWQPKRALPLFVLFQLIGVAPFGLGLSFGVWFFYLAAFFFGLGLGAVLLGVLAIIAGGRGGVAAFILAFGVVLILGNYLRQLAPAAARVSLSSFGVSCMVAVIGAILFLGLLLLLPANSDFFNGPPPRGRSFLPTRRNPFEVAFLALIPLYNVYHILRWLYLIHGEVAHLSPSPTMLSPKAAIGTAFVPFLSLVSLAAMIEQLNIRASQVNKPPYSSPLAMFLWSLLFFPLGMALTQPAVNRLIEAN